MIRHSVKTLFYDQYAITWTVNASVCRLYVRLFVRLCCVSAYHYAGKQLLLSLRLSHRNPVRLSVCLFVTRVDQSKTVQARIIKSSPTTVWKTLVSKTVRLYHKFEGGHPERRR